MAKKVRNVGEEAIHRAGFKTGSRLIVFLSWWAVLEVELGRQPNVEEFAVAFRRSPAQSYRDLAVWREVFPEFDTPTQFFEAAKVVRETRTLERVNLMLLPFPS